MLNTVALIGRLGADPEVRCTPSGVPVPNFRIAVNEFWTDQSGEKQERPALLGDSDRDPLVLLCGLEESCRNCRELSRQRFPGWHLRITPVPPMAGANRCR
jgi:hypothetical protein